jgi:hypothetical protein
MDFARWYMIEWVGQVRGIIRHHMRRGGRRRRELDREGWQLYR